MKNERKEDVSQAITEDYIGVKHVQARPMTRSKYNDYKGWHLPADENPEDDGYLVIYPDGYESWCPKKQFEEAYRSTSSMPFGHAIEAAKKGYKIAREGWNGKGMWLCHIPGGQWGIGSHIPYDAGHFESELLPWIGMKTADGKFVPWLASQTDILADDWMIV